jgi:hypothetical protein
MIRKILLCAAFLALPLAPLFAVCPAAGEVAEDCPWAGAARDLAAAADSGAGLEKVFKAELPGLLAQMDQNRAVPGLLGLWGESINYDELANSEIVRPEILSFIAARLGALQPRGRIVHAGLEHTYGYLFSLLPTRFGFKRARWVKPDIAKGLGLPAGSAGPAPSEGTLLANITCLAGGIALKDDPAAWAAVRKVGAGCSAAVKKYAFSAVKRTRLSEEVALPGGRRVTLRTDFAPFLAPAGGNTHLLVYSVRDTAAAHAYLVTAFPVNAGFVQNATASGTLGKDKPVQTRYNAHVEGLTGAGKFKGLRAAALLEK